MDSSRVQESVATPTEPRRRCGSSIPAALSLQPVSGRDPVSHRRILIVDDNPEIHEDFRKILARSVEDGDWDAVEAALFEGTVSRSTRPASPRIMEPFELDSADQGQAAASMVRRAAEGGRPYALAFIDIRMPPGWDGVQTAREIWRIDPRVQVVLCTAYSDYSWEDMVTQLGYGDNFLVLKKPFDLIEVRQTAQALSGKWKLLREKEAHLEALEVKVRKRTIELENANAQLRNEMADRLKLEKRLRQAHKLEALGRLLAGIGHEINNPLAYILSNLEYARSELVSLEETERIPMGPVCEALEEAEAGAKLIRKIVEGVRAFSKPREATPSAVDVQECILAATRIVGNELRHRARLVNAFEDVPPVVADVHRLEQVFVNLLLNAIKAMPVDQADQHVIRISTSRDRENRVSISVSDDGCGISEGDLERVFDPFFSTRPLGSGTGLGLWISKGIVEGFGGTIEIDSRKGEGTTVRLTLLNAERSGLSISPTGAPGGPASRIHKSGRAARLLIVDDEAALLRGMKRALRAHDTVLCTSAREAIELLRSQTFDLIFCDLMMPGLGGRDLHAALQAMNPDYVQRIVFMTGGVFSEEIRDFLSRVGNLCISKPFDWAQLHALIEQALSRTSSPRELPSSD